MGRLLTLLLGAMALTGCADEACFRWTKTMRVTESQVCPARKDAAMFMGKCDVQTVDSEGSFDEKAGTCCYAVTKPKTSPNDASCPTSRGPGGFD